MFDIAASAALLSVPLSADDDRTDLGALAVQQYPDPVGRLRPLGRGFVRSRPTDTLSLLKDLSAGVAGWVRYQSREDEGTQSPIETLDRGWGSCRDFAVLFVEAARSLGFGARIVSGYRVQSRARSGIERAHPCLGRSLRAGGGLDHLRSDQPRVGGFNLIPVAVVRDIRQATPVAGSFIGTTDAFQGMSVDVSVSSKRHAAPVT